ncbi:hypothetical protein BRARA_C03059 [Brassica rapa]|uniref:Phorbol-ester/DAG-type domain-containing protein n=1 Tax=Brassica campestris TaxID=3711 RepID=A0A397ZZZ7_BRACM|nr:hypothetical protein BRARA_C03059 [Brassica rapa]
MNITRAYKLPIHNHPLFPSAVFCYVECDGCHVKEPIYGGYICNELSCYGWFHKECAEAPPEINHHPSHSEHPLLLTNDSQPKDSPCDCLDLICGMKPSPPAIENPMCHDHSLVFLKKREVDVPCEACKESIGGPSYSCLECHNVYFHLDCVHLQKEVNHPCHPSHPLKVVALADNQDAEKSCHFCVFQPEKKVCYHCSVCNFTMCFGCIKNPPPLVIENTKTHKHPLRLLLSRIAFTCKVCGIQGYRSKPYICVKCDFLVHGDCIGLPRVININRHDHQISFTQHLGRRGTQCGFCWRDVSQYYGAYFCSVCPNYTVHSLCAFIYNAWNGVNLEGIPERSEDISPFKVVGHNLIHHFSHNKHTLRLLKDNVDIQDDECIRCEACIHPVQVGQIYSYTECCFVLHEKCANLPMMKRFLFDRTAYMLECDRSATYCKLCGMFVCWFQNNYCDACKRVPHDYMLRCDKCDFDLCLYCVTLPEKIWHMSDEHPLTLSCDGNMSGKNWCWCDICESELDPSKWFFMCSHCGVALHVQCVLGDFSRLKPGGLYTLFERREYEVVLNNRNTRPFCSHCRSRCKVPVILKDSGKDNGYICSNSCLFSCLGIKFV